MNRERMRLCASAEWAALVGDKLLPWVLGDDELETTSWRSGPGPAWSPTGRVIRWREGRTAVL